jgi:Tol biopolymer transport system component/predicted Ser/Thr protein kinase
MHLTPGTRLGPYAIVAPVGSGGMGEVYKARDTRLERAVAIKVLPADTTDPDRRRRFLHEARSASALNHPAIVSIYDVGTEGDIDFIAMELIDGEPLDRLALRRRIPLVDALSYGSQIADALARAHAAGIVHRDLKPANVMVLGDGRVKVLDFGLAKLVRPGDASIRTLETGTALTAEGHIVGTVAYVSPEQAEGRPVDARSDVFSFGALLYELVTGQRAFHGNSAVGTLASVLHQDPPPIRSIDSSLPEELERIVARCLRKDPERRFQTMADLKVALDELRDEVAVKRSSRQGSRHRAGTIAAGIAAVIVVAVLALIFLRPTPDPGQVARLAIALPQDASADPGRLLGAPAISPDGTMVVVTLGAENNTYLSLRRLDSDTFHRIPGTEGGITPFWSPDSRHIAFFANGMLKRVPVAGGVPQTICSLRGVAGSRGGAWNAAGTILIGTNYGKGFGVLRVSDSGGAPVPVTRLDERLGENSHRFPVFLPDGKRFLYFARTRAEENRGIYLASLDREPGERRKLLVADSYVAVASNRSSGADYLLYPKDGNLWAQRFDTTAGSLDGEPVVLSGDVGVFTISNTGTLVARRVGMEQTQLTWFDRSGKMLDTLGEPADYPGVQLSPDDKHVAVVVHRAVSGYFAIWLVDPARRVWTPFTLQTERSVAPVWFPDGKRVYFRSESRDFHHFSKSIEGGAEEPIVTASQIIRPRDISPDGSHVLGERWPSPQGGVTTLVHARMGTDDWRPLISSGFSEENGQFSPDGKWVAYQSNESGTTEIWVTDFPGGRRKHRVSEKRGREPRWRRDGRELFYIGADNHMTSVAVAPDFAQMRSTPLFRVALVYRPNEDPHYDVTGDGQRFLVASGKTDDARTLNVVFNWPALLHSRAQ